MCYTHSMPFTSTFIFKFKNISYQAPGFSNICAWAKDAADTTGSGRLFHRQIPLGKKECWYARILCIEAGQM